MKNTYNIIHNKKIYLKTIRGREVSCTPEHLILTNTGFKKAEELKEGDLIAIYLLNNFPLIEDDNRTFLTEEKVKDTASKFGLNKERYIDELRDKGLLKLSYNKKKAYILANLLGYLLTDGCISLQRNNERTAEFFVANKGDKELLLKDLEYLGFEANCRYQETIGKINNREFNQKIIRVRISKTSFFLLMRSLEMIEGEKFIKGMKIPEWILNGPKQIQKAFLQGFLGGDGPKAEIRIVEREKYKPYNKICINPIEFHFYENAENDIEKFADELSLLLNNLGVSVRKIDIKKEDRYERKDKKISILLRVYLNTNSLSAYNYCSIGFKYAYTKAFSSSIAREYIKEKENKNQKIIDYDSWINIYKGKNSLLHDKIEIIKEDSGKQYPFVSISLDNDTKMFVANDIIHHNCMPCLMMAPIFEEMSERFKGKIKFAKVNVDDNQELASKFKVMSIPTTIIFRDGKEIKRFIGAMQAEDLENKIKAVI